MTREERSELYSAGFALSRMAEGTPEEIAQAREWILEILAGGGALPPSGVVLDLGLLFTGKEVRSSRSFPFEGEKWRRVLHGYDEHLLARLAMEPLRNDCADAFVALHPRERSGALAFLIGRFLERIGYISRLSLSGAVVRRILREMPEEIVRTARSFPVTEEVSQYFLNEYEEILNRCRSTHRLLEENDLFILENFQSLKRFSRRLELEQILDGARLFRSRWPHRIKSSHHRVGVVATNMSDESSYPTGGFSSLSTKGSLENLVPSELIYMDRGPELSLFDMRYCEGELLYYSRDDSSFFRECRSLYFEFLSDLGDSRYKDADLPFQRLTLTEGLLTALLFHIKGALREEELKFYIVFPEGDAGAKEDLDRERELLEMIFRRDILSGLVSFEPIEFDDLPGERTRITFFARTPPKQEAGRITFRVGRLPEIRTGGKEHLFSSEDPFRAWVESGLHLMGYLV